MNTGYHDIDGTLISEGDILEGASNPALRGIVVCAADGHYIACGNPPGEFKYHIDDAPHWRIIGNVKESPEGES